MIEKVQIGDAELWCGDCRDVLPQLPAVDCVITDPPYFKVKGDYWDNEWEKPAEFLAWMRGVLGLLADRMKPNGSAYVFASPQMAGRVEAVAWERLNVLGHMVWRKGSAGRTTTGWHQKAEKEALRGFLFETERVIFAEHYGSDKDAAKDAGYELQCQDALRQVFQIGPLAEAQGVTRTQIAAAIAADYKNMESAKAQASNWILGKNIPNHKDFARLKMMLPICGEYEDLRREYEELRRPFTLTERDQWGDVWEFDPVPNYPGKHPCEKPLPLLAHMLNASTRPGAVVLDAFMGSGATGDACLQMGRKFIGIERDRGHFENACRRIQAQQAQDRLFA